MRGHDFSIILVARNHSNRAATIACLPLSSDSVGLTSGSPEEPQKSGIPPREAETLVATCRNAYGLNIVGLMCIPPDGVPPGPYFAQMVSLARACGVTGLSMGMSADFETAIAMGATHVRVGSVLFGHRPKPA